MSRKVKIRTAKERASDEKLLRRFRTWLDASEVALYHIDTCYHHGFLQKEHYFNSLSYGLKSGNPKWRRSALRAIRYHLRQAQAI